MCVRTRTSRITVRQLAAIAGGARPSHFRVMIIGIGSDLCDIRRIEKSLARFGERFTHRVFTEGERSKSDRRATRAASYARRFAAKEACSKALGTGMRSGVFWRDMEVVNLPSGKPTIRLTGGARERLAGMVPDGYEAVVHVSLTDDPPLAQAFVIIEAVRRGGRAAAGP
jgi:holo-[acyl-carrier protein] synthase